MPSASTQLHSSALQGINNPARRHLLDQAANRCRGGSTAQRARSKPRFARRTARAQNFSGHCNCKCWQQPALQGVCRTLGQDTARIPPLDSKKAPPAARAPRLLFTRMEEVIIVDTRLPWAAAAGLEPTLRAASPGACGATSATGSRGQAATRVMRPRPPPAPSLRRLSCRGRSGAEACPGTHARTEPDRVRGDGQIFPAASLSTKVQRQAGLVSSLASSREPETWLG